MKIKLFHNDYPEEIQEQIKRKFGEDSIQIIKTREGELEIEFNEEEYPWKHVGTIGRSLDDLMEENEWISSYR